MTGRVRSTVLAALAMEACFFDMARLGEWGVHYTRFLVLYTLAFAAYGFIVRQVLAAERDDAGWGETSHTWLMARFLGLALVFRLTALCAVDSPSLSDDIYRYLWEGRVWGAGFNPYVYAPDAPKLAYLRDAVWTLVNHKDIPAIYPPVLQFLFVGVALLSYSVIAMKIPFVLADIALVAVVYAYLRRRGLPVARVSLYAFNPLIIVEFAGNGHVDVLAMLFLMAALLMWDRGRRLRGAIVLALSILTKYFAVALLPILWRARISGEDRGASRRIPALVALLAVPVVIAVFYWPFLDGGVHLVSAINAYAEHWYFNQSAYGLAYVATGDNALAAKLCVGGMFFAIVIVLAVRRTELLTAAYILAAAFPLLSPTVHPWYAAWVIPFLPFFPPRRGNASLALCVWSFTVVFAYHVLPEWKAAGVWEESLAWRLAEYLPVYGLLAVALFRRMRTRAQ